MLSQDSQEVGLYFVIPGELKSKEECEAIMLDVFKECQKQSLEPQWLTETKCLALQPDKLNVFVFQRFEGKAFEHLSQFKCVLIGPQCLLTIFKDSSQLPHLPKPFFTMAMNGLIVAASGFGQEGKERLRKKIELMAGQYVSQLKAGTTHLIVNSVLSEKYIKAISNSIPIMTEDWLDAVYSASLKGCVKASDPKFDKFKCPPFKGLKITTSKLSASTKKRIVELIESNGGIHSGSLSTSTDMLIVSKADGEKFMHARNWNLPCLHPTYVKDCVRQGCALPLEGYEIKGKYLSASSPNNQPRPAEDFDYSTMSRISNIAPPERSHIDETLISDITTASVADLTTTTFKTPWKPRGAPSGESVFVKPLAPFVPSSPNRSSSSEASTRSNLTPKKTSPAQFKHLLEDLDLTKTKQAGQFLDGCKVFLYGFDTEHEEKLRRVLKGSGASRFTELSESITHILVGNVFDKAFSKQVKELSYRPHIVTLQWLLQSVTLRRAANEEQYCYAEAEANNAAPETPSPLSKKGLALLQRGDESPVAERGSNSRTVVDSAKLSAKKSSRFLKELRESDPEVEDLTAFYRQESVTAAPPPPTNHTDVTGSDDSKEYSAICSQDYVQFFSGLKFTIVGLNEDVVDEITKIVVRNGGQVVHRTFKGVPDYAVVPLTGAPVSAAGEIVTPYWVDDCVFQNSVVPVEYFHQPLSIHEGKAPLRGCVIGVSGYTRKERLFLMDITTLLGGTAQEVFARKDNPEKNAQASTHLVCSAGEGSKFNAAVKWNLPAVSNMWLLECCTSGRRSSVRPFLVDPKQEIVENIPPDEEDEDAEVEPVQNTGKSRQSVTPLKPLALKRVVGEAAAFSPFRVSTPDTPYGVSGNPSPEERKRTKKWIDRFPDYPLSPERSKRRLSTPLSEIKKQVWHKVGITTTPETPDKDKQGCKRSSVDCEETLPQSSKRARLEEVSEKSEGADTPKGTEKVTITKALFPETVSRAEGYLEEAKKLLEMPLQTSGISSACTSGSNSSPLKEKTVPRVPKEVSQPYEINWADPVTVAEAKKDPQYENRRSSISLASCSKRKSVESEDDTPNKKASVEADTAQNEQSKEERLTNYVFMLSNIADREGYESKVEKLGGKVVTGVNFEKTMTHLVIDKPARNEKLLASIASGKWVLHTSYIQDSYKAGKFLEEADYEWGAPKNAKLMAVLRPGSNEVALAKAAYRWRQKLSGTSSGAFEGVRAVIGAGPNRIDSFRRLIEAGGGIVLKSNDLDKATHYFLDTNVKSPQDVDNPAKVPIYPLLYLSEFLMKGSKSEN